MAQSFSKGYLDSLARKHKFVQRKSRLDASSFLSLLMFSGKAPQETSLEDLAVDFCDRSGKGITKQAIQQRFNGPAVAFLESVLADQLSNQLPTLDKQHCPHFNRVRIKDSTRYSVPKNMAEVYPGHGGGGGPAQISIQYEYDLITGKIHDLSLTGATRNDQRDSKETLYNIEKGDLLIRDLGYATQGYIKHIHQTGAYYLNRINPNWTVMDKQLKKIDYANILKKLKRKSLAILEMNVMIRIGKELVPSRLIVSRVDQKTYEKRMKNTNKPSKRRGNNVRASYKTTAALNIFITNIPSEWMTTDQVRNVYGLRWQIELIFKTWKSKLQINKVRSVRTQRFQCELMARFIWILINWQAYRIAQAQMTKKCSTWKFFKAAIRVSHQLREVLFEKNPINNWLKTILSNADQRYRTEIKRGKPDYTGILAALLA